jgi:hypothetical protein
MNRKIRNYQLIFIAYFVFLFSSYLTAYGEPLFVPYDSNPADQGMASLIFNNCYSQQLVKNPIPGNVTIQMACNQEVKDNVELSHSVANGMEAIPSSFENLPRSFAN